MAATARPSVDADAREGAGAARAAATLQRTLDVLSRRARADDFIPEVLQIAADAFDARSCAFGEHADGMIPLRYWWHEGRMIGPTELPRVDTGREHELDVPLVVDGAAVGRLVIYRPGDAPFDAGDVALGAALGKQLALALHLRARAADREDPHAALARAVADTSDGAHFDTLAARVVREIARATGAELACFFAYDARANTLRVTMRVLDGEVLEGPFPDEPAVMRGAFDADLTPAFRALPTIDDLLLQSTAEHVPYGWPGIIAWHRAQGRTESAASVVRAGAQPLGALGLGFRDRPGGLSTRERHLVRTLSNDLALILQVANAAEAAKDLALERQRVSAAEARSAELANANQVMRATLAELTREPDLDYFLARVLEAITEQLGALGADLWLYDPGANIVELHTTCLDGNATREPPPGCPRRYPFDAIDTAAILRGECRFEDDFLAIVGRLDPAGYAFYSARGARAVLRVPVAVGANVIGNIAISKGDTQPFSRAEEGLALALAQQAALAIHTERLDAKARQAAVTRERQAAAEAHLASLQSANDALRRGTERVGQDGGLDALLGAFLLEAMQVTGASGSCITEWQDRRFRRIVAIAEDGVIVPVERWRDEPWIRETAEVLGRDDGGFATLLISRPVLRTTIGEVSSFWPAMAAYHARRGHVEAWNVACGFKECLLAHLTLAFRQPREMDALTVSTLTSLAQQMTLALELTALADQAKRAAVELETGRAIAAERSRLAGDIHDSLAQSFTSIALQSESLISNLDDGSPIRPTLEVIEQTARLGLAEARRSVLALRPIGDSVGDLQAALVQLAERCNIAGSFTCEFRTSTHACPLRADVRDAVLRVAQEAVSNALRHSGGKRLVIEFDVRDREAILSVTDDGVGVPELAPLRAGGFGMSGMRARAESLGGIFLLKSAPGARGTTVQMRVPL